MINLKLDYVKIYKKKIYIYIENVQESFINTICQENVQLFPSNQNARQLQIKP
jgi:hypothetical protein